MKSIVLCLFLFACSQFVMAQTGSGLRGMVKNAKGDVLPYAAILVKGTNQGTITNEEGRYEISLAPGNYTVAFQYLGFQTIQKSVTIETGFTTLDVALEEQALRLAEVQTKAGNEDPAYTIMRRAIAKSRFHQLQVTQYKARNYSKASVLVKKLPAIANLFKKQLAEAERDFNFKVGVPMLYETIREISFQQPATYRQRVIASRNSQVDQVVPLQSILGTIYAPKVGGAVSPLSPAAFGYYTFEYQGTFSEPGPDGQRVEVSKIRVSPRSWGEGVVRGVLFIIENTWAVHSYQFERITGQGISYNTRCTYSPIKGVWLPVNFRGESTGSIYGVDFQAQFAISQSYPQLTINPAFVEDIQVVDEKKDRTATVLKQRDLKGQSFEETVKKQKELTTKNFKQLVKEYEKQQFKERKRKGEDVQVVRNDSVAVDSLAGKRSMAFWDSVRAVPLTNAEVKSYTKNDSLRVVREVKAKADSLKGKKKDKFSPVGFVLVGSTFKLAPKSRLVWTSPVSNIEYNTVEGYSVEGKLYFNRLASKADSLRAPVVFRNDPRWYAGVAGRYQFGRKQLVGYGQAGVRFRNGNLDVSGGRYFYQYNPDNPISPALNSFATLWFKENFMKLYQKDFVKLTGTARLFDERLTLSGSLEYAQRSQLANFKEDIKPWIEWRNRTFSANQPVNVELPNTSFPTHNALTLDLTARINLGAVQYRIRNGARIALTDTDAPVLSFNYRRGMADVNYDFVQAGLRQSIETGIRSRLSYAFSAGTFLTDKRLYFPDFKHFMGNEFWFQQGDPVTVFRLLPYYQYSTAKRFAEVHLFGEFRKFLITQVTVLRLLDLRENLFVNYLTTPSLKNYVEVGYGLNGIIPKILPVFRIEVIGQFQDGNYQGLGYRVGTTLRFGR
jgi:hypothetical protein